MKEQLATFNLFVREEDAVETVFALKAARNDKLAALAKRLEEQIGEQASGLPEKYRDRAFEQYHKDGECEIDPGAPVSLSADKGAYVMAWVWVYDKDCGINSDEEGDSY